MDSYSHFLKEASIRANNNHIICPPLQADLYLFHEWTREPTHRADRVKPQSDNLWAANHQQPSETKQHIHLLISTSNPAEAHSLQTPLTSRPRSLVPSTPLAMNLWHLWHLCWCCPGSVPSWASLCRHNDPQLLCCRWTPLPPPLTTALPVWYRPQKSLETIINK